MKKVTTDLPDEKSKEVESESNGGLTLGEICNLLEGRFVCGEEQHAARATKACSTDLMSDVLAYGKPGAVLLTGLNNSQVVRAADMLDLKAVVFVRNRKPDDATLEMAESINLPLIVSPLPLFDSCGRLFSAGIQGCTNHSDESA